MFYKTASAIFVGILLLSSSAYSQEINANAKKHFWSKIVYPPVDGKWGNDHKLYPTVRANTDRSAFLFELSIKGPKEHDNNAFDVPNLSEWEIRLHSADGRVRPPIGDCAVTRIWNDKAQEWSAKITAVFPWTRNEFDEACVELRTAESVLYFELPYGFTRDPNSELCSPSQLGSPETIKSIRPIRLGSKVIWWQHVEYAFGEVEPGWQLLLLVSNPFDLRCDVLIRPLAHERELPEYFRKIQLSLLRENRKETTARQLLGRLYPTTPEHSLNSADVNFFRIPGEDRRWGVFELSVEDRRFTTVVPSSLFQHGHGVSDYYRGAETFSTNFGPPSLDPRIPFYRRCKEDLVGFAKVGGTLTFPFLLHDFEELYPKLQIKSEFNGNETAIETLVAGNVDLVIMTRPLTMNEIVRFKNKFGHPPIPVPIAINRVGIFVHPDNPIAERGLSLPEADAIFSSTRKLGYKNDINRWGELGLDGPWKDQLIQRYSNWGGGPTTSFDNNTLFERQVIKYGKFKEFRCPPKTGEPGAIVRRIDSNFGADDKYGIGFGVVREKLDLFKAVPIGQPPKFPTAGNCYRGDYPLIEEIYIVVSPEHLQQDEIRVTSPAVREILTYLLSRAGQAIVSDGYLPLSYDLANASASKVGVELAVRDSYLDTPPAIAGVISQTNSPAEFESLILELSQPIDDGQGSSRQATRVIKQWQRSRCFEPLIETVTYFDDTKSAVSAAVSLVTLGREEYWTVLRDYARHEHKRMRSWLIHELRSCHHIEAIEILIGLLGDETVVLVAPRTNIADQALAALCSLTKRDFGNSQSKWREWWDSIGKKEFEPAPLQ